MERIYLDANATTPVLPEVVEAMLPYFTTAAGNPSSAHLAGQRTRSAVERARASVAKLLNASAKEIVFTSGGTESDNLALFGVLQPYLDRREPAHLITTQIEHHAVLYAAQALEARRVEVTYLAPNREGLVEAETFTAALRPHTRIAKAFAEEHGTQILVHTDAVQAAGKQSLDLAGEFKNVDLLALSGHKMYAPQGTGALFVRKSVQLAPLQFGGPQERQRRAGTENVPGIVALGRAAELANEFLNSKLETDYSKLNLNNEHLATLRDRLESGLLAAMPGTYINGSTTYRAANTTNLRFAGIDAESLLIALDMQGIAASFGAACQSGATEPSHVLLAMGLSAAEARSSLRLSLSRLTTEDEIDSALEIIPAAVARLRSITKG
jgi:cysteine desulfurase